LMVLRQTSRTARLLLVLSCWICQLRPAGSVIDIYLEQRLTRAVGSKIAGEFVECSASVAVCNIHWLARKIATIAEEILEDFDEYRYGRPFKPDDCTELISTITTDVAALRGLCAATGNWSGQCTRVQNSLVERLADQTWELGVACRIIDPGPSKQLLPTCDDLAIAAVSGQDTLTTCHNFNRSECVQNFCNIYGQFHWRLRPRNLEEDPPAGVDPLFGDEFYLPGCPLMAEHSFDSEQCYLREDVNAFCDCICEAMPSVQFQNGWDCPVMIDQYLMFGRLGVEAIDLHRDCEPELCSMLARQAGREQCANLNLPKMQDCTAMSLDQVETTCPWLTDSGEDGVLECLDGHRCRLDEEGWACCESHLGRGRCPRDMPVMCDTLCSGITEFCCETKGRCTPRTCPTVLLPEVQYLPITTTMTSTFPPPGSGKDFEEEGWSFRVQQGSWVWLLLVIPTLLLVAILFLVIRIKNAPQPVPEPATKLEEEGDKLGGFHRVRPKPGQFDALRKRPVVSIEVGNLPEQRPLGLELLETKVVRVHSLGEKWGFEVGDVIVEIGGVPVDTFEDLWARIQVERDRPPTKFLVERLGADGVDRDELEVANGGASAGGKRARSKRRGASKIAPSEAADEAAGGKGEEHSFSASAKKWAGGSPMGSTAALPSAMVGWETWATPPRKVDVEGIIVDPLSVASPTAAAAGGGGSSSPSGSVPPSPTQRRKVKESETGSRADLTTTRFMRAYPETAKSKLLRTMTKKRDPADNDVRWVRDAWGRHVLRVGGKT